MSLPSWIRTLFSPKARPIAARPRPRPRLEVLEDRLAPTIDLNVVVGGTLDVNPVSSIFPSAVDTRMDVLTTSVPGLNHGTMYRVSFTDAYAWGSGPPNTFEPAASPSFNQNRIFSGEGFRYVNDGTGLGQTESIPVKFSDGTTDTLVIHINSADAAPQITSQPSPAISQVGPGQSVTLSVTATGTGTLSYQWYSGLTPNTTNPVPGATSSTFTAPPQTVGGQYLYWVQVSNASGVVNSLNATVTVEEGTTTTATPATVTYSRAAQQAPMQATVTRSSSGVFGIPDGGVTFTVPGVGSAASTDSTHNPPGIPANVALATLTIPGRTHAGVYPIDASYLGNIPLYLAPSSDNSQTLTILKANQTISGFGALPVKTYGDAPFTIGAGVSATSDPDAGGVTFTSLNPSVAVVNGTTVTIVGAGTAIIVASQAGNEDWNPAPNVEQTLTVNPAALKITADDASRSYGAANPAFTVSYSGFVNGDGPGQLLSQPTVTTNATSASRVGTYSLTAGGATTPNYIITYVSGTLKVTPALLTVTADDKNRPYSLANPALTASYSGFVNGEDLASSGVTGSPSLTTSATISSPAGTYAIVSAAGTLAADNYSFRFVNGTLTVNKVTPTITWSNPADITFGTALDGTQLDATADVPGTFTYGPAAGTVLGAGTQTLSATFTPADAVDYNTVTQTATLTVDKATPTLSWPDPADITYGTPLGDTQLDATADVPGTFTYSPAAGTVLSAGSDILSVTFTPTDTADYTTASASVTLTVTPAPLTITPAAGQSKVYGAAVPGLTYSPIGFVNGDTPALLTGALGTTATAASPAGNYSFTLGTLDAGPNYALALAANPPTFAVTQASPTITWASPADIVYGTALGSTQLDATADVPGTFAYGPDFGAVLGAGSDILSVTFTPTDTADYTTASASVTLTVDKADPTVTWPTPGPITYGTPLSAIDLNAPAVTLPGAGFEAPHVNGVNSGFLYNPPLNPDQGQPWTFTGTTGDGSGVTGNLSAFTALNPTAPEGEQVAFIQATGSISQTLPLDAGSYTVSFLAAQRANQASTQEIEVLIDGKEVGRITPSGTDYAAYTTGVFTVAAGEHTLRFQGLNPQGGDNTAFIDQIVIAPGVAGTFAFTQPPDTVLDAGTHQLPVTFTPADTADYNSASTDVTLTVDPAALTITPDAGQSMVYGGAVPALTYGASGFVNGDPAFTLSGSLGTTATSASPVGNYAFTLGSLSAGSNYTLDLAPDAPTFAVTPAPLTVTPNAGQSMVYGDVLPTLTYTASGFVNGDPASTLSGSLWTTATSASSVGNYAFTLGSLAAGTNYTLALAPNPATFAVTPATLTVTADDAARLYGDANPSLTARYSGFVNGDTPATAGVTGTPILTTAAADSPPGDYAIQVDVSPLTAANYTFTPVAGTLTVAPAPLSAAGVDITGTVGAAFSGTVATFANADPFGGPDSYAAVIAWGDGTTSAGTITDSGGGTFAVSGSHTYTSAGAAPIHVQISHRLGDTTAATADATAAVSGDAVFTGTGGDSLVVTRTPGGAPGDVTYTRDGRTPVALHGVTSLTFNGTGSDTLTVSLANGGPLVSGAVTANGGTLSLDAAGLPVQITPGRFSAAGLSLLFSNVAATLVSNAAAGNTFPGPDTADRATAFAGLTPEERFVQALYLDDLGRPGRRDELDYWVGVLGAPGGSPAGAPRGRALV
jgi:hypothetical protein